jgi:hypothetical protein
VTNSYGVPNEEATAYLMIHVCSGWRQPWPEFWAQNRYFG